MTTLVLLKMNDYFYDLLISHSYFHTLLMMVKCVKSTRLEPHEIFVQKLQIAAFVMVNQIFLTSEKHNFGLFA